MSGALRDDTDHPFTEDFIRQGLTEQSSSEDRSSNKDRAASSNAEDGQASSGLGSSPSASSSENDEDADPAFWQEEENMEAWQKSA